MVLAAPNPQIFISNIQKIMRIKKEFVLREVCGENVIVGEGLAALNFGKMIALNDSAAWLWKQAQEIGDFTIEELADRLNEHYEVSIDQARKDVTNIVSKWTNEGLVETDN